MSGKAYNSLYRACSFTLFIKASKATSLSNSFTLSTSSLNLFKYAHVDLLSVGNPKKLYGASLGGYIGT